MYNQTYYTMNFKQWILDLFKDERGQPSIKPVTTALCTICLCISLFISVISKRTLTPSDKLVDAVTAIAIIGIGGDVLDKFSLRKKESSPPDSDNPDQKV